jgi:hypothetical protein
MAAGSPLQPQLTLRVAKRGHQPNVRSREREPCRYAAWSLTALFHAELAGALDLNTERSDALKHVLTGLRRRRRAVPGGASMRCLGIGGERADGTRGRRTSSGAGSMTRRLPRSTRLGNGVRSIRIHELLVPAKTDRILKACAHPSVGFFHPLQVRIEDTMPHLLLTRSLCSLGRGDDVRRGVVLGPKLAVVNLLRRGEQGTVSVSRNQRFLNMKLNAMIPLLLVKNELVHTPQWNCSLLHQRPSTGVGIDP